MTQLKNIVLTDFNPEFIKTEKQIISDYQENGEMHEQAKNVLVED